MLVLYYPPTWERGYAIKKYAPCFGEDNSFLLWFEKMQIIKSHEGQTLVQELLLYGLNSVTGAIPQSLYVPPGYTY